MVAASELLKPVRQDAPAGADLRSVDNTIGVIREHRRRDHPLAANPKEADWEATIAAATAALRNRTKDLEIAAYLCEAWTRTEGLTGLLRGLELVDGLVTGFWPHLHPGLEVEKGAPVIVAAVRRKWLSWIGSVDDFLECVRSVPLTVAVGGQGPLRLSDLESSSRVEEAQRINQTQYADMIAAGATTPEIWSRGIAATSDEQKKATRALGEQCLQALQRLQEHSDLALKESGMSANLIPLRDLLEKVRDLAVGPGKPGGGGATGTGGGGSGTTDSGGGDPGGPLRTRQDAVRMLRDVGNFLRSTEPHSPVSYLVDRCVRWLNFGFEELMADLVKTEEGLGRMRDTLGLQRPQEQQPPQK